MGTEGLAMIAVVDLHKSYAGVAVLKGVSLQVARGEVLTVFGPSGCGKTTLLRIIAGLETADRGSVQFNGVEANAPRRPIPPNRRGLSMVFQDLALWPNMTVREHLHFVLKAGRFPRAELSARAAQMLEVVRLAGLEKRYPSQLSGGERQRLAIARALVTEPAYLLMDEPFSHLDLFLLEELQQLIGQLHEKLQAGLIYVTHQAREGLAMAHRVALMNGGALIGVKDREELMAPSPEEALKRAFKTAVG